jgi:hypothetical protein
MISVEGPTHLQRRWEEEGIKIGGGGRRRGEGRRKGGGGGEGWRSRGRRAACWGGGGWWAGGLTWVRLMRVMRMEVISTVEVTMMRCMMMGVMMMHGLLIVVTEDVIYSFYRN